MEWLFHGMRKGIRDPLYYLCGYPFVIYIQLAVVVVVTQKNKSELSEVENVRSKAAKLEKGESNTVLAASTEKVVCLMAAIDTKNS